MERRCGEVIGCNHIILRSVIVRMCLRFILSNNLISQEYDLFRSTHKYSNSMLLHALYKMYRIRYVLLRIYNKKRCIRCN